MTDKIINPDKNKKKYPDSKLLGRHRLVYNWIESKNDTLLDAGCSYGYATQFYAQKSNKVVGIELDDEQINFAKNNYPGIEFISCSIEKIPFKDEFFDVIVMTDVIEHLPDRIIVLNELNRILKSNGYIIITSPHKGIFTFLDPYNYGYFLRKYMSFFYKILYKLIRLIKDKKFPEEYNPVHEEKHHHFKKVDYIQMLDNSSFRGGYNIEKTMRTGLFIEVFHLTLEVMLKIFIKNNNIVKNIIKPLVWLSDKDYFIDYGIFAYNIILKIRKKKI